MLLDYDSGLSAGPIVGPPKTDKDLITYFNARLTRLNKARDDAGVVPHWRDIANRMTERRTAYLCSSPSGAGRINRSLLHHAPVTYAKRSANGIMAGLTPKSTKWFNFTLEDRVLAEKPGVRVWLDDVERLINQLMESSNLYTMLPLLYLHLVLFGTAAMLVLDDYEASSAPLAGMLAGQDVALDALPNMPKRLFHCVVMSPGEYSLGVNKHHVADTMVREYECTVEQVVSDFGLDNCSEKVKKCWAGNQRETKVRVRHAIEANTARNPKRGDNQNFVYRSVYWESDATDKFLRSTGFNERALFVPRWDVAEQNDAYGSGPGSLALQTAEALFAQIRRKYWGYDKATNPPLVAPTDMEEDGISLIPGAISYSDDPDKIRVTPVYGKDYNPRLVELQADIDQLVEALKHIFMLDMLAPISNMEGVQPRQQLELIARQRENLTLLAPLTERFEHEFLTGLLDRIWGMAARWNLLPPPPREIAGRDVKVVFVGPLSLAQKARSMSATEAVVQFVATLVQMGFATAGDQLNVDGVVTEYADLQNTSPGVLNSQERVAEIREERALTQKQAAAMQLGTLLKDLGQAGKAMGETPVGAGKTALQAVEESAA